MQRSTVAVLSVLCLAVGGLGLSAPPARGQTVDSLSLSPDVTVDLDEVGGGTFDDEDVAVDDLAGTTTAASLGPLPAATEVTGFALLPGGDRLFCVATTVELPGPLFAQQGDVVRYDGSTYTLAFDASASGVPAAAQCDAVAVDADGKLWLSFDITVELPDGGGGTLTADDEDAVRVDGPGAFTLLDATALGVPDELDLDGLHRFANGNLAASFDTSGQIGSALLFDDEDVVARDETTSSWSLLVDASARDADWGPADADAVALPEPGLALLQGAGLASLLLLARWRDGG